MKNSLVIPALFLAACATTGSSGKGSSAPFQGADAVTKRRAEITDAAKTPNQECMQLKKDDAFHGGLFSVTADAAGKLTIEPLRWSGPETAKQCVLGEAGKLTITPLAGPPVSSTW